MTRRDALQHRFVDTAPDDLDDGIVYISIPYATALHRCACGCGTEVITPLSPGGWTLIYNGQSVSLHPSIGNWNFPCRSHYWIRQGRVQWVKSRRDAPRDSGRPLVHVPGRHGDPAEVSRSEAGKNPLRQVRNVVARLRRRAR